jgi:hypothetical protein
MYTTNKEYRQAIRDFFQMKCQQIKYEDLELDEELDEETADEYTYDSCAVEKGLNRIYEKTKSIDAFSKLYEYAAALMFSTDPETGLAVLFSYDYFAPFNKVYTIFMNDETVDLELTTEYDQLFRQITPTK